MTDSRKEQGETISFEFKTVSARRAAHDETHGRYISPEERRCLEIENKVNQELWRPWANLMRRCEGEYDWRFCFPLKLPPIQPLIGIVWGDSRCDCVEGDDTEVMQIIVCNRYSNLVMTDFTIHRVTVVKADGSPVPLLPDGSPSIQIVPLGPYCYGDIAPCTCVTRHFTLRLRGAPGGSYRILLEGICFGACFQQLQQECFTFEVCKD